MKGKLTISIDLELAWGVWDHLATEHLRMAQSAERPICASLMELFDRHGVSATWAIVAALLDEKSAAFKPGDTSCWFAPDIVERLCQTKTPHEIASHGGRHIYFDRIGSAEAEDDLGFARDIHQRFGLSFTSFVFPRNAVGYLALLARAGIMVFRGADLGWASASRRVSVRLGQAANFFDKALPLVPPVANVSVHAGLADVPGCMLLMGRNGWRRCIHLSITRAKLKSALERARRVGGVFHLWFHPSNFYYRSDEQFATLDWFLGYAAEAASRGDIEICTLGTYANQARSPAPEAHSGLYC